MHESQSTHNTGPLHHPRIGTGHVGHAKVEISQRIRTHGQRHSTAGGIRILCINSKGNLLELLDLDRSL